uniref:B1234D02.10 protein n=1 Tax=Oryza sativa subsp. japonica TaxID=39947 RepID=Q7XWM5_ORYSJ|nr:OSJNBb0052B05.4 [Oryza sativa Japonica Group]CAE75886.1 B1234D02.10 [Oryza sativa Japonica Group]
MVGVMKMTLTESTSRIIWRMNILLTLNKMIEMLVIDDGYITIVEIPPFDGKYDPDAYLSWEIVVDQKFACHEFPENTRVRAVTKETEDAAIARFLGGLNREIYDIVDYKDYNNMTRLFYLACKAEREVQGRRASAKANFSAASKAAQPAASASSMASTAEQEMFGATVARALGMCSVTTLANNEPLEEHIGAEDADRYEGLIVQRVLSAQIEKAEQNQRHILFQTKCVIKERSCRMIIEGGSYNNLASSEIVQKLALTTKPHPHPYYIQWLNNSGKAKVAYALEYSDVFPKEVPPGLPLVRGIEHQIDLILGASLPNRAPYRTNPEETKGFSVKFRNYLIKGDPKTISSPTKLPPAKMSSSASPSITPSAEYAEHLSNLVVIPSLSHEHHYFLNLIGNLDPTEFIIVETNRIPFTLANPNLGHWKTPSSLGHLLRKPPLRKSWAVWYKCVSASKQKDARVWFPYEDSVNLDLPADFRFEDLNSEKFDKSREVFSAAISPCILPVGIHQGGNIQVSYEFYHPMSSARQFGMGQLPIGLFFADKIQCQGEISSALMMDRLLNIPGPPLGSIESIELARPRSRNLDKWWGEWNQHIFHQSASMYMTDLFPDVVPQTTESSPPCKTNNGRDIEYAPGLLPNGGVLTPPVIGYHAPKTSSLIQGQMREPADVGRKRKTKAPAIDPSTLAPKKKAKKQKPKPADDLPTLDPSIEQALDEEEIEEDVDQAAAELSDIGEKTPSASPKQTSPTPAAPAHFSRKKKTAVRKKSAATTFKPAPPPPPPPSPPVQQTLSDRTPSATGSHNIEEEEQPAVPAIPALADLISRITLMRQRKKPQARL